MSPLTALGAPLTRSDLAAHMDAMLPHAHTVAYSTFERELSVACVDGRQDQCVAGAPGGNAGLLILLLSAREALTGEVLTDVEVDGLFRRYVDHFGAFYLHTDRITQARLQQALGLRQLSPEEMDAVLRSPPPELREELLRALVHPENVGCGHLSLLLQEAPSYGVRRELVEEVLRAFHRRLWEGDPRLTLDVLEGRHDETGVAHIHSPGSGVVPACPRFGTLELFVHHPQVVEYLHALHAVFLVREGLLPSSQIKEFMEVQEALGSKHLEFTLGRLAPNLPVFDVHLDTDPSGALVLREVAPKSQPRTESPTPDLEAPDLQTPDHRMEPCHS